MTDRVEEWGSLGSWVRRRRKALDLTQAMLADRVSCAEVTIRKIETDAMRPSRSMAERLARSLTLSPDEQAVFLQVAGGERGSGRLPAPHAALALTPPAAVGSSPRRLFELYTPPPPAPLPPGSRMPLRRNPLFVGRDRDLYQMAQALNVGGSAAIGHPEIAAVTGLGGIGKTQLACEFVHRYGQFFEGGVFWLSFADPTAIPAEIAACGGGDGMQLSPEFGTLPLDEQVQRVRTAWANPLPRLLVFDNCEEEALLEQWRPKHGGARVLLTSRHYHWDPALGVQRLPLDVLLRDDSLALLRSFRPDLATADADLAAIAEMLGDLPLALHLAGSFLAKYRHALTLAQYRERLRAPTILDDRSLQATGVSPTQHVQHVARTFEQSYARLNPAEPTDALARTLLAHAACFAPGEPLPRWLLIQTLEVPDEDVERTLIAEDALMRLIDLGLLETDVAGGLRLHRLLVAFVQAVLVDRAAQAVVEATMLRVADTLNGQQNPDALLALQPHLRFITEAAQPPADARMAGLYHALGSHLWQLGVYPEAQRYLEQALSIRQRILAPDHLDLATSLNRLGVVLAGQGQYAEAQNYLEQALAIRRQVLGPDHLDTTYSLSNLGVLLAGQGQYAAAQDYLERALAVWQQTLGMDGPHIAMSLSNLGLLLQEQGQYAAAQDYLERALAIRQRFLGADHLDTARSLHNLGLLFHRQGQYAAAQDYLEQALSIWQQTLTMDHPDLAYSLHSLGVVLKDQGQYAMAQDYLEQALAIRQRFLGADHLDTARSMAGLGGALHVQGQIAPARHYLERALAIYEQRLGLEHPDTDQTRRMLAALDIHRNVTDREGDPQARVA